MWHETLFDKRKASAYRCKKAFCGLQNAFSTRALPRTLHGELTTLPRPPRRLGWGHSPIPHFTRFLRLRRSPLRASMGGIAPKYFFSRTGPGCTASELNEAWLPDVADGRSSWMSRQKHYVRFTDSSEALCADGIMYGWHYVCTPDTITLSKIMA